MTTYHPTSEAAAGQLLRLLDNEDKEIATLVIELRQRVLNRSRLASSILLLDLMPPDTTNDDQTRRVAEMLAMTGGQSGGQV